MTRAEAYSVAQAAKLAGHTNITVTHHTESHRFWVQTETAFWLSANDARDALGLTAPV